MYSLTVSWETSFHTGHRYMCLSVNAVCLPGYPLTLNEPSKGPVVVLLNCIYSSMATSRKGAGSHNMHKPREVTVICA